MGKILKTILIVIGASTVAVYLSNERNRAKSQEKARELGNYLLGKVKDEKDLIRNKTKNLMSKTKAVGNEVEKMISDYGKNPV